MRPNERTVSIAGGGCRVWELGGGKPLGVLGGLGGVPRWTEFYERLAENRRVVVVSPPGFPGSGDQHRTFTGYLDWIVSTLDLLEEAGLAGADLMGASIGGLLAADAAAMSPHTVGRLILAAPFGMYDVGDPGADPFAQTPEGAIAVQSVDAAAWQVAFDPPEGTDQEALLDWAVMLYRAADAAARIAWPFGDRGIVRRLHRIRQPTLVLWGEQDQILPVSYAEKFAKHLGGPVEIRLLAAAGHQLLIDQPAAAAGAVAKFLDDPELGS